MEKFDVAVIGAGPAGGQCARELAKKGKKILLIDRLKHLAVNPYSSGGAPISLMRQFDLPDSLIGSKWNKLRLTSPNYSNVWRGKNDLGVILDFAKLRSYLAEDASNKGATMLLHHSYVAQEKQGDGIKLTLKNLDNDNLIEYSVKLLVDATGTDRQILGQHKIDKANMLEGTGIEYLIKAPQHIYEKYDKTLSFYFGHCWMPQGYAWIFPMEKPYLKIGVIRYFADKTLIPYEKPFQPYLENLLKHCLNDSEREAEIIDKHGKTIYYSLGSRDQILQDSTIAIGDAISMINPLAYEGIRHALHSGRIAANCLNSVLDGEARTLNPYANEIYRYKALPWKVTELIMKHIYTLPNERGFDAAIKAFEAFNAEEILQMGFDYNLSKMAKFYFNYIWLLLKKN